MTQTISQVFAQKKLWAWFNDGVTNAFNGTTEKGEDYSTAFGTPVAVPVGGVIKRIVHNNNAINDVVELMDANGAVWLYQHINARVRLGDTLQCGSVIGTENGLPVDQFSTGPHIEVRYCPPGRWNPNIDSWIEPWINPASIFGGIGAQIAGQTAGGIGLPFINLNGNGGAGGRGALTLAPNADVTALLNVLDQTLLLLDPFDMTEVKTDTVAGITFTDPVAWLQQFGQNVVDDLTALTIRLLFLALGFFILYKVLSAFIDFGAAASAASGAISTVAQGAALAL